jgi:hypothetical protein
MYLSRAGPANGAAKTHNIAAFMRRSEYALPRAIKPSEIPLISGGMAVAELGGTTAADVRSGTGIAANTLMDNRK